VSSNVETTQNEQRTPQTPSLNLNSARNLAIADDATQLLLTQLGIMRRKFFFISNKRENHD
jgi:hypothetical protein